MCGEMCQLRHAAVRAEAVHVHCASVAFTQEIVPARRSGCGIRVFAASFGQVGVLSAAGVVAPYVACHSRCVVLAPFVFKSLDILVEERRAIRLPADIAGRGGEHARCSSAVGRHGVQLRHACFREKGAACRILYGC